MAEDDPMVGHVATPVTAQQCYVHALHPELAELAADYAQRSGAILAVAVTEDVAQTMVHHVFIGLYSDMSDALAERCAEIENRYGMTPGLLLADDPTALAERLARSAQGLEADVAASAAELPVCRTTWVTTRVSSRRIVEPGISVRIVGQDADAGDVRQALAEPADLLILETHSDGYDSPLPGGAILCPYVSRFTAADSQDVSLDSSGMAACIQTGSCHRLQSLRGSALASQRLVDATSLHGDVLLFLACFVMPLHIPGRHAGSTLGALLNEGNTNALICPIDAAFLPAGSAMRFMQACVQATNLGQAVAQCNRQAQRDGDRLQLFLFGDPRLQRGLAAARRSYGGVVRSDSEVVEDAALLRRLVAAQALLRQLQAKAQERTDLALDREAALERFRSAERAIVALAKRREAGGQAERAETQAALCGIDRHMSSCVALFYSPVCWSMAAATVIGVPSLRSCPHCAGSCRVWSGTMAGQRREALSCRVCGIVEDAEAGDTAIAVRLQPRNGDLDIHIAVQVAGPVCVCIKLMPQGAQPYVVMKELPGGTIRYSVRMLLVEAGGGGMAQRLVDIQIIAIHGARLSYSGKRMVLLERC